MNQPTPAIVAQSAVRRLPRVALLVFCAAYVVAGFVGRDPWKNADITAFGYMFEIARGHTSWLQPQVLGLPPEFQALLPYWMGAWAIQLAPAWLHPDFAARLPFVALLVVSLLATWYAVYYLARTPAAQPVPFAFGGEARPTDYARAIADGGLLALVASLGLMQLSHETTPALAQLGFTALAFYGFAALPYRVALPALSLLVGLVGLGLSGAPAMAMLFAAGGIVLQFGDAPEELSRGAAPAQGAALIALAAMVAAVVAAALGMWEWRLEPVSEFTQRHWAGFARLLAWFTWPAWPLVLWTVWRWRRQLGHRHVALPLWFALVAIFSSALSLTPDRALLLGLPALAALAAFALPTFSRSASALIDWFSLLFFSGCALVIWVIWLAMQTGFPATPARNVARLAPGFTPTFGVVAFAVAVVATLAWFSLVRWRTQRSRHAIWKSLVLPAGGTALAWVLVTTLWLPVLDYARSYTAAMQLLTTHIDGPGCVQAFGLTRSQITALMYHGRLDVRTAATDSPCTWLVAAEELEASVPTAFDKRHWKLVARIPRPADSHENLLLYRKK